MQRGPAPESAGAMTTKDGSNQMNRRTAMTSVTPALALTRADDATYRARRGPTRALLPMLRRLHPAELAHLRAHAARLERENDRLQCDNEALRSEVEWADDRSAMLEDALNRVDDVRLGLTMSGELLVAPAEVPHHG